MKFAIGIPTLNRADLLFPSLNLYCNRDFPTTKIYILDNGNQNIKPPKSNVEIINCENLSVAASWNKLSNIIFEDNEFALILNDDIFLGKNENQIHELMKKKKPMRCILDWCAFLLPRSVYKKVGVFDEQFTPAYYEDSDYEYRAKLLNLQVVKTPELNPYVYLSNQTLKKNPALAEIVKANKLRYIEKWGGEPNREIFKSPKK